MPHLGQVITEREIIELMLRDLRKLSTLGLPYGDDASSFPISKSLVAVLKADMLVGRTDVPPGMSIREAGRKAVVMNVSDFASKGVQPRAVMTSIGLPRETSRREIAQLARGINEGAREYGAYVLGGDTNLANDLIVSVFLYGAARPSQLIARNGAKPGDLVLTSGTFGHQAAGLRILLRRGRAPSRLAAKLVKSVLRPRARLSLGVNLAKRKVATSCIDSSDGLAWSLHEIARASKVGVRISKLPTSSLAKQFARINRVGVKELVLYGGEEYELVLTAPKERLKRLPSKFRDSLISIGEVTDEPGRVVFASGRKIEARGFDHFAQ